MDYDVIVAGGGISGASAAISAARCGARTLVVEQNGFLGGMLTAGGVAPMMTFHAGEKQVVKGIPGELIDRLKKKGKSPGHIFDTTTYVNTVTPFDHEGMKLELELMLKESGGEILYHTMVAEVETKEGNIKSITVCNKAGLSKLTAKVYVDATGDADISEWAGVGYTFGRSSDNMAQPMTMSIRMINVNIDEIKNYVRMNINEFPEYMGDTGIIDKACKLSLGGFDKILKEAQEKREITFKRERVLFFEGNNKGEVIINTTRITNLPSTDPWCLSRAETEGRRQADELVAFLKNKIPGFADSCVGFTGPSIGVRSSRQIKGLYTITKEDLLNEARFSDVICHGGYPVDIHPPEGELTPEQFKQFVIEGWQMKGKIYSIPYRCLLNDKVDNLITVGRCISATFEAQASLRLSPIASAIGHGGGAAAFLASYYGVKARDVDINELQRIIKEQGGYLEV